MKSFFVVSAAVCALIGCASTSSEPEDTASSEEAVSGNACHTHCQKCPANRVCALVCTLSGNCGTTCTETMLCIQGYAWDDKSCQCIPAP